MSGWVEGGSSERVGGWREDQVSEWVEGGSGERVGGGNSVCYLLCHSSSF